MNNKEIQHIKYAYFLGIGGIGMSAIARYFLSLGIKVWGFDKTSTTLTKELEKEGMNIHYEDNIQRIPSEILNNSQQSLVVVTPAVPKNHSEWNYFLDNGFEVFKRSEVLGIISQSAFTIGVAGTHGKTTTSTLIAYLLESCGINFTSFLGGISANFNSNYYKKEDGINLFADKEIVVLEADEFDRSFHRLNPDIAVITAIDADHLDIYGSAEAFYKAFEIYAGKIKTGGQLIIQKDVEFNKKAAETILTYGINKSIISDFNAVDVAIENGSFVFNFVSPEKKLKMVCGLPGFHNIENATAALAVCSILNLNDSDLQKGISSFRGVKRRFEYLVKNENYVLIDDYAHHPEELSAIINSVKALYPNKKLTGIFQPHLFSRTRDFADGFAKSLSALDELMLMDIYPARELPIEGITSSWLLKQVKCRTKSLLSPEDILAKVNTEKPELLLILGAGDIDKLSQPLKICYESF